MNNDLTPFHLLAIVLAGWSNRHQQTVIDYLIEDNRILKDQLEGRRLRFTDAQRRLRPGYTQQGNLIEFKVIFLGQIVNLSVHEILFFFDKILKSSYCKTSIFILSRTNERTAGSP